MKIISHRGLGFGVEENSLVSYETALKEGYSIEIDVYATLDGVLVISHDPDLKRIHNIDKNIMQVNHEELKYLLPTLEDVFLIFKKYLSEYKLIAIHVKSESEQLLELLAKEIKKHNLVKNCLVFDLAKKGCEKIRSIDRDILFAFSVSEKRFLETIYLWEDLEDQEGYDSIWLDEWNKGLYIPEVFKKIKEKEKKIYAISPELHKNENHPNSKNLEQIKEVWKKLIQGQVDGICTDYPKELQELIKQLNL